MERNLRKTRIGKVVSDKMDKTIVVAIEEHVAHPLYKKIVKEKPTNKTYRLVIHLTLILRMIILILCLEPGHHVAIQH